MQTDRPDPETSGRHRRVQVPPAPPETGRHRVVTAPPLRAAESASPTPALPTSAPPRPVRRRHAADEAPSSHPDARRRRSRTPQRVIAGATLLLITVTPVLARSTTALGMHDAVAAEVAAHPDQADDTLAALTAGGVLAGAASPSPAVVPSAPADRGARAAERDGTAPAPANAAATRSDAAAHNPDSADRPAPGSATASSASAGSPTVTGRPMPPGTRPVTPVPTDAKPTGTESTGTKQKGTERTGTERTGTERTGTERTGTERTGTEQTGATPTDGSTPTTSDLPPPETTDAPSTDEPLVQSSLIQDTPPASPATPSTGAPGTTVAPQPSEPAPTPSPSATAEASAGTVAALIERVGALVGP